MLIAPLVSGALVSGWQWHQAPLAVLVLAGYLTFNAATWWVKLPPVRRHQAVRPTVIYGAVAAASGLLTLAVAGPAIVGWLAVLAVPLAAALGLTARKRERSLASGLVTTLAASTIAVVAAAPDPVRWLQAPSWPLAAAALVNFGYFAGTVWSVKSMIRERGSTGFLRASVGWHAAWTVAAALAAAFTGLSWFWVGFFALTTVRALWLPLLSRRSPISPLKIGLVEIGFTTLMLVGFALFH